MNGIFKGVVRKFEAQNPNYGYGLEEVAVAEQGAVVWSGRQWAITEHGMCSLDGADPIGRDQILGEDWKEPRIGHNGAKRWVDIADFAIVFQFARLYHSEIRKYEIDQTQHRSTG